MHWKLFATLAETAGERVVEGRVRFHVDVDLAFAGGLGERGEEFPVHTSLKGAGHKEGSTTERYRCGRGPRSASQRSWRAASEEPVGQR